MKGLAAIAMSVPGVARMQPRALSAPRQATRSIIRNGPGVLSRLGSHVSLRPIRRPSSGSNVPFVAAEINDGFGGLIEL